MVMFDAFMIILVKYGYQWVCGYVSPRGSYGPKGLIPCKQNDYSLLYFDDHLSEGI